MSENEAFIMLLAIRKSYRQRKWGKLAPLRKGGNSALYFPPEYCAWFAYQAITPDFMTVFE